MLVRVPRQIKDNEYCTGIIPSSLLELRHHGHCWQEALRSDPGLVDGLNVHAGQICC